MDINFARYLGVSIKWICSGFKNNFRNELYGKNKHTRIFKSISIHNENILLGLSFSLVIIMLIVAVFFWLSISQTTTSTATFAIYTGIQPSFNPSPIFSAEVHCKDLPAWRVQTFDGKRDRSSSIQEDALPQRSHMSTEQPLQPGSCTPEGVPQSWNCSTL